MSTLASLSSTTRMRAGSRTTLSPSAHELAHLRQELARAEGLGDVAVAAGIARLLLIARARVGGDGDHGYRLELGNGLDAAGRLVAVDHRELDVHEDEVGLVLRRHGDALLAGHGLDHLVAGAGQEIADDGSVVLGVLDHEDALAHAASSFRSTR